MTCRICNDKGTDGYGQACECRVYNHGMHERIADLESALAAERALADELAYLLGAFHDGCSGNDFRRTVVAALTKHAAARGNK